MNKRRYFQNKVETTVTPEILNKSNKLLAKKEFCSLLNTDYEVYRTNFLKNSLTKFYGANHNANWFIEKYIQRKEINYNDKISQFNTFDTNNTSLDNENIDLNMFTTHSKNIIMEIWKKDSVDDLLEKLKEIKGFLELNTYYTNEKDNIQYFAIISVEDDTIFDEFASSLRRLTDVVLYIKPFVADKIVYNYSNINLMQVDKTNSYYLIKMYCERYNVQYQIPDASTDYYILFLRYVFNHCYYCVKQFDSVIQMVKECGTYHIRADSNSQRRLFDRKNHILINNQKFNFLENIEAGFFYKYTAKNNGFACDLCNKEFNDIEFIEGHYKKKHFDELINYDDVVLKNKRWLEFCSNIDTMVIMSVTGIGDWYIPGYVMKLDVNYTIGNNTVYDIGHIYSGEIILNKE